VVIVIDVIRAFSVAAYALAGGSEELWLVRTVEEALTMRERAPHALLIGEVGGRLIHGFDCNNSPARMAAMDVRGRLLIQRTGAGTQGAVGATGATHLLVCALVNARATAAVAAEQRGRATIDGGPTVGACVAWMWGVNILMLVSMDGLPIPAVNGPGHADAA
jgi:2-phosphosulfolactate phosphatase